jgi:hypothetical protein
MLAHNSLTLDNRDIQQEAAAAHARSVISPEEDERIRAAYPFKLYTPNFFVRIGLFLLTALAVSCGLGLFLLMTMGLGEHAFGVVLIFWGVVAYVGLELFIRFRGVYRAGVDDALLWAAGWLVIGGINILAYRIPPSAESGMALVLAGWGVLRYADRLMALVAYGSLIGVTFYLFVSGGAFLGSILPFVIMAVSVFAYLVFRRLAAMGRFRHYHSCLSLLRMAALVSFYLSGNYYVVQQVGASIRGEAASVPVGWFWWIFTVVVPVVYVVAGLRKKDVVLLWTGLGLVAAVIWTVRHYYHVLPVEVAMVGGGVILMVGAYGIIRWLRVPKYGFTSDAPDEPHLLENLQVEGLVIAEGLKGVGVPATGTGLGQGGRFGGGSSDGGGAGGGY